MCTASAAVQPSGLLFRRRRRDLPQPVDFRLAEPFLKIALWRQLRKSDLSAEDRDAIWSGMGDNNLLNAAYQTIDVEMVPPDGRDWEGFADFLERIIPLIVEAIKQLLPLFLGGIPA